MFVHETESEEDWWQMIDTNVMGLLRMTRLLLPQMIKQKSGHILNIGSNAGRNPYAGDAVYCATKSAVITLTEVLRHELLGQPIRVTTIDPGLVRTEFNLVRLNGDHEKVLFTKVCSLLQLKMWLNVFYLRRPVQVMSILMQ